MNVKCTIIKFLISLILSPVIVYAVLILAKLFGASYELTHGVTYGDFDIL